MDDLSQISILLSNNRIKPTYSRLSIVQEDSQEDDNQTVMNDQQSDTSDFDIIESNNNNNINANELLHE
ncbi:unnamed protein product, partial [Adineta steineri]